MVNQQRVLGRGGGCELKRESAVTWFQILQAAHIDYLGYYLGIIRLSRDSKKNKTFSVIKIPSRDIQSHTEARRTKKSFDTP